MRLDIASPSGSRTVGTATTRDREVEVAAHPPDEQQLLGVLLPEVRRAAPGQVHELADDREHAVEVPRPGLALEHVAERAGGDAHARVALGVDDVGGRREDEVDASGRADLEVGVEGARVAREVLLGPELERVEEDRHDDVAVRLAGLVDQRRVPLVQGAHRHDDGDVAVVERRPGLAQLLAGAGDDRGDGRRRGWRGGVGHGWSSSCASSSSSGSASAARRRPLSRARCAVARASAR